jgi:hypothetical protein
VQVEPEVALYCDILYNSACGSTGTGPNKDTNPADRRVLVDKLVPRKIAAFNDCSLRALEGSTKLSEKKNWGFASKGISLSTFPLTRFDADYENSLASRLVF